MLSSTFARAAQRTIVWCLLIAAPVYAVSAGVAQVIGSQQTRRAAVHLDQPLRGWHDVVLAIGHDVSRAQLHPSSLERHCPVPAAVGALDARAFDSLADDASDAASAFGFALVPPAPIAPLVAASSPPRHSHAIAVLTGDGRRLDRPPNT